MTWKIWYVDLSLSFLHHHLSSALQTNFQGFQGRQNEIYRPPNLHEPPAHVSSSSSLFLRCPTFLCIPRGVNRRDAFFAVHYVNYSPGRGATPPSLRRRPQLFFRGILAIFSWPRRREEVYIENMASLLTLQLFRFWGDRKELSSSEINIVGRENFDIPEPPWMRSTGGHGWAHSFCAARRP